MKNQLNWKLLGLAVMMMFSPLFGAGQVNLDSGLVAYYPFNGNADDESGNGLNGIVSGALLTQDRFGRDNHAYYFDNINDYIQIANSNNVFNLIGSWAISLWIHPYSISGTSAANDPILWKIAYNNTNQDNYAILWNNNFDGTAKIGGQIERASDDHDFGFGGGTFTEKQDYHVLVNVGNDSITLIVNGDSVSARALPTNLVPYMGPAPLRIGNNQHSNHGDKGVFHGVIDDIRIYHRSLTKEEIYALYNESGNSTPISETNIIPLSIFPNPSNGLVQIQSPEAAIESIRIVDLLGREILAEVESSRNEAQIHSTYQGIVSVVMQTSEGLILRKIIFE